MTSTRPDLRRYRRSAAIAGSAVALLLAMAPMTRAQDPADIREGMELFMDRANCQACHGWAGDGRKTDNQMPDGANLRERDLDRETLVMTIKCGRPGTGMPAFDRLAYSDGRCFGLKAADLRARQLTLPDPPATLQPNQINMIVDFLLAKVVNKGQLTRAKCPEYWGKPVESCEELPN